MLGFKKTLILATIFLISIILSISNWLSYTKIEALTKKNINEQISTIVDYEAIKIENWFKAKALAIDTLANKYKSGEIKDNFVETLSLINVANDFEEVMFGFEDGTSFAAAVGTNPRWIDGVSIKGKYDPRARGWYKQAKQATGLELTDIGIDLQTKKSALSIVKFFGEGVVLGDITLDVLEKTVKEIKIKNAKIAIFDDKGASIASTSDLFKVGMELDKLGLNKLKNAMLDSKSARVEYKFNEQNKIAFTKSIELVNNKKWHLLVQLDASDAYLVIQNSLTSAIQSSLLMIIISGILITILFNFLYRPILTLKDLVLDLSIGNADLTRRLPVKSKDDLGIISNSINTFISNLQSLMLDVAKGSEKIYETIEKLEKGAYGNEKLINIHSEEMGQMVDAISLLNSTALTVSDKANEASSTTFETTKHVSDSKIMMKGNIELSSELINDMEETSNNILNNKKEIEEIGQILRVIGEIADQTNLLALNAAIEAARAGEQGRGFAVVADEVRTLAARTQKSTAEIENTLNRLTNGSSLVVSSMDKTKAACSKSSESSKEIDQGLNIINELIKELNNLNSSISTSSTDQSLLTDEVTKNINAIANIIKDLLVSSKDSLEQTKLLSTTNSELQSVLKQFKIN